MKHERKNKKNSSSFVITLLVDPLLELVTGLFDLRGRGLHALNPILFTPAIYRDMSEQRRHESGEWTVRRTKERRQIRKGGKEDAIIQ